MKAPDGTIDCRAGESGSTTNKGNSSPPQLFSIQGGDKVLLSLVQVRKQQGVFLLKFVSGAHSSSIAEPSPFVTPNDLRALEMSISCGLLTRLRAGLPESASQGLDALGAARDDTTLTG